MKNKDRSPTTDFEETEKEHSNKAYFSPLIAFQALVDFTLGIQLT